MMSEKRCPAICDGHCIYCSSSLNSLRRRCAQHTGVQLCVPLALLPLPATVIVLDLQLHSGHYQNYHLTILRAIAISLVFLSLLCNGVLYISMSAFLSALHYIM